MASESIAHSAFGLMGYDSEPIQAGAIIVKYMYIIITMIIAIINIAIIVIECCFSHQSALFFRF